MQAFFEVGVDEVGRGPLAGPVTICVAKVPNNFDWNLLAGVGDSKKVSEKNRKIITTKAVVLKKQGQIDYAICSVTAKEIDKIGMTAAVRMAIDTGIGLLQLDVTTVHIKLDGLLSAPSEFSQETITKGDMKEKVIGLASILAKEHRDAYMVLQSGKPEFLPYNFAQHKGYGTKDHRKAVKLHGLSTLHRESYCKNKNSW